jgi:hypothetical protein
MNHNSPPKAKRPTTSGLRVDRITRIIIEQWPDIWQAVVDRQTKQLEHRRVLILEARNHLRQKAS